MRSIEFTVTGDPVPKGRPRMSRCGHAYTPERTRKAEKRIADAFRRLDADPFESAVSIRIECVFTPPRSWSKRNKAAAIDGAIKKCSKPDVDNLAKTVCDALNGIAWLDDSQIVRMSAVKRYGSESYTTVKISEDVY